MCERCGDGVRGTITLLGYDMPMDYSPDKYQLIAKISYDQAVENCSTCFGEGSPMGCGECGM